MERDNGGAAVFLAAVITLGISGIVAQTIILRELLILFAGNEFSLGIIIGFWIVCEAAGAYTAGRYSKTFSSSVVLFTGITLIFSVIFPLTIYIVRIFKSVIGIPPDIGVSIGTIIYSSLLVHIMVGFLHGFLFIHACALYHAVSGREEASAAGTIYFYETAGTIAGGIAVSYLAIPYLNSFRISFLIALINGLACIALIFFSRNRRRYAFIAILFTGAVFVGLVSGLDKLLHDNSIKKQWQGKNIVQYQNTYYQNVAVVQNGNQYSFFTDGILNITTPVPDIYYVEDIVHFPMLSHPAPENVLVLGGGAGGVINELLKYPSLKHIDHVETDPGLLRMIQAFPTPMTQKELTSPIVQLHNTDGRLFVQTIGRKYDLVLLNALPAGTLQSNRFFTREVFKAIRTILADNGILILPMNGSLTYYNEAMKDMNGSLSKSLRAVFPYVRIIPGDTNLMMASVSSQIAVITPDAMIKRLKDRNINSKIMTLNYLKHRMSPETELWLAEALADSKAKLNADYSPNLVWYTMGYKNQLFSPYLATFFTWAENITLIHCLILVAVVCVIAFVSVNRFWTMAIPFAIATTGFSAMIMELILFSAFQIVYGYVFHQAGILISAFMGGIAAGSIIMTKKMNNMKDPLSVFKTIEAGLVILSIVMLGALYILSSFAMTQSSMVYAGFIALLVITGVLTGAEFPLASKLYSRNTSEQGTGIGVIYSSDLIGGWLGGILGGIILLPVVGMREGCVLLAVLKAGSLVILWLRYK